MSVIARSAGLASGLFFTGLFSAGLVTTAAGPARAASPFTQAFLTNVVPNVDFLDRSSRLALVHSKSKRLKDFAFSEAWEQTLASNAIYDWTLADAAPKLAPTAATDKTMLEKASIDKAGLVKAPLDQTPTGSTGPASAAATPMTETAPTDATAPLATDRLPMGQEELDSLEGLDGAEFDALYKEKQKEALAQVAEDYAAYLAQGDDAALKALAARELPKVRTRIGVLGKL